MAMLWPGLLCDRWKSALRCCVAALLAWASYYMMFRMTFTLYYVTCSSVYTVSAHPTLVGVLHWLAAPCMCKICMPLLACLQVRSGGRGMC